MIRIKEIKYLILLLRLLFLNKIMEKTIDKMNKIKPIIIISPPESQAFKVGGIEIIMFASPPNAAKPITPKLTIPALPHWIFIPRVIIEDIMHKLNIVSATFQLWKNPTEIKAVNIKKYKIFIRDKFVIFKSLNNFPFINPSWFY